MLGQYMTLKFLIFYYVTLEQLEILKYYSFDY